MSQPTIQGLDHAFRVALAYEATLRWDDYEDMTFGDFIVTNDFWSVGHLCSFDSLEFCLSIVSYAFSKLSSELSLEQIAQWSVMFRGETRFADCKRVKNEISGIPEEPQTSLSSFGVRRGYAWNAFPSERLRYGPIPMWHPWSGHQDLWPMEISGFSTLYRSGDDSIVPCEYLVWDTHV